MLRTSRSMLSNVVLIMALALATLAVAPGRSAAAQAQELMFKVIANGIEGPKQAQAGLATLAAENATGEPGFGVFLARVKEGKTLADVQAALGQGGEQSVDAARALLDDVGGVFGFAPGMPARFTTTLRPGTYILAADPSKGQLAPFEVATGSGGSAAEPTADVDVILRDFQFVMPTSIPAGAKTWKVTNAGPQPHELIYFQLLPGKTVEDVLNAPEDAPPPIDLTTLGGVPGMIPGITQWSSANPMLGRYVAVCFVQDPATQKPHAALGMVAEFTIGTAAGSGTLPATGEAPLPVALPNTGAGSGVLPLIAAALVFFGLGIGLRRRRRTV